MGVSYLAAAERPTVMLLRLSLADIPMLVSVPASGVSDGLSSR